MASSGIHIPGYSLSEVICTAIRGLNTVDHCLAEAERRKDPGAVRWLQETRAHYRRILGTTQEFVRDRNHTSVM